MTADTETPLAMLKVRDRALYAACLYAPESKRDAVATLHLYELETRRIRDLVSEPMPGEIRLQWWRDVLAGMREGEARANPLAAALLDVVERYSLDPVMLERLADARIFDLYDDPMPTVEDLQSYCGQTFSTVLQLAAQVLGEGSAPPSGNAAGHAGCALGVAHMLGAMHRHRSRGQVFVPLDMLSATGSSRERFLANEDGEASSRVIEAFRSLGEDHLSQAMGQIGKLESALRPAFLPLAGAKTVLAASRKAGRGVMTEPVSVSPIRQQWTLLRMAMKL